MDTLLFKFNGPRHLVEINHHNIERKAENIGD